MFERSAPYEYIIGETLSELRIFYDVTKLFELSLEQVTCGATKITWSETREDGQNISFSQWAREDLNVLEMPQAPSSMAGIWNFDYRVYKPVYSSNPGLSKFYSTEYNDFVFQVDFKLPVCECEYAVITPFDLCCGDASPSALPTLDELVTTFQNESPFM